MQPTTQDLEALRGLVRWLRTSSGEHELRIRAAAEGLERAILAIESKTDSITELLLVAFHQGMEQQHGNRWRIVDQDLVGYASQELVKRYGPNPGAPRVEPPRKPFS